MESVDDGSQMRVSATGGLFDGFTYDQTAAEATRLDGGDAEFDILEGGSFDEGAPAGGGDGVQPYIFNTDGPSPQYGRRDFYMSRADIERILHG